LGFYSGRAKDIDNDNNNRFYKRNTWQKNYFIKSKSIKQAGADTMKPYNG
jgi:hypothetical protein